MARFKTFTVTPVMDTAIYANNDVAFVPIKVPDFWDAPLTANLLTSVCVLDKAVQSVAIDLLFLRSNVTLGTINSAASISDTDAEQIAGMQSILAADYKSHVNSSFACVGNIWKTLLAGSASPDLWLAGMIRSGTPTYAANSLIIEIGVQRPGA